MPHIDTDLLSLVAELKSLAEQEHACIRDHDASSLVGLIYEKAGYGASLDEGKTRTLSRIAQVVKVIENNGEGSDCPEATADIQSRKQTALRLGYKSFSQYQKVDAIEDEAKRHLLAGDRQRAEETYLTAEELRPRDLKLGLKGAHGHFLHWLVKANQLDQATALWTAIDWDGPYQRVESARNITSALIQAGRRDEGIEFLSRLRHPPDLKKKLTADDIRMRKFLGLALTSLGATEEGFGQLQEASRMSIAMCCRNKKLSSVSFLLFNSGPFEIGPFAIADSQLTVGDRSGAEVTLQGVEAIRENASTSWPKTAAIRAELFVRADMEQHAFEILAEPNIERSLVYEGIARGQAARGAFDSAFAALQSLQNDDASSNPEIIIGRVAYNIAIHAAESGDWTAFSKAFAICRTYQLQDAARFDLWEGTLSYGLRRPLKRLAQSGRLTIALQIARIFESPGARISALLAAAEAVSNISDPVDDVSEHTSWLDGR